MSDAAVKFYDDESPGPVPAAKATTFSFKCPVHDRRCGELHIAGRNPNLKRDGQGQNGGVAMWDFDGNEAAPTFTPSVNCKGCWHGYIEHGRCVSVSKTDEPETGHAIRQA